MQNNSNSKIPLWKLFFTFAKIGATTFGGGYAMLPVLDAELVDKNGWVTSEDLTDWFAIGQCTPGVIAVNVATFTGKKIRGNIGGVAATLGVVFPSIVIISIISAFIKGFAEYEVVKHAFAGIRVCVCVLILNSVIKLFKSGVKTAFALGLFIAVFAAAVLLDISPIPLVLASGVIGGVYGWIKDRRSAE